MKHSIRIYTKKKDKNIVVVERIPVHRLMEDFYRIITRVYTNYTPKEVRQLEQARR